MFHLFFDCLDCYDWKCLANATQCCTHVWPIHGQYMANTWPIFEKIYSFLWLSWLLWLKMHGQPMQCLVNTWPILANARHGYTYSQSRKEFKFILVKKWILTYNPPIATFKLFNGSFYDVWINIQFLHTSESAFFQFSKVLCRQTAWKCVFNDYDFVWYSFLSSSTAVLTSNNV